jgi:outer membrane protein assembly factor BamB
MKTLLSLVLFALPLVSRADDTKALDNWPHWRGPLANGYAPKADPPTKWDAATNIKWKTPLEGRGSATPIVWGDQIFVVTAIKSDKKLDAANLPKPDPRFQKRTNAPTNYYQFVVVSYDRHTGKERWRHQAAERVPHEGHHDTHSYAAGSPTTDGKFLYVSFGSFGIYCYDLGGILQWSRDLGKLNTRLGWGEAVTPVVHGDSLLLNWDQEDDSSLICLDTKSGKTRWKTPRDEKTSWNTPLVVEHRGTTQVIVNATNRVRSYDLANGKEIWSCGGMTTNAIPSPVAKDGVVYCMSGYRGAASFALSLDSKWDVTGKELWKYNKGTPYVPSPLLLGKRLWFTQANMNLLTILDIENGKPVVAGERLPGTRGYYGSPAAAAGKVYLTDRDGNTVVLKDADKLEVLATNKLDDPVDASPVLVGKHIYLRGEKYLYCVGSD